jgi:hypothetical protein
MSNTKQKTKINYIGWYNTNKPSLYVFTSGNGELPQEVIDFLKNQIDLLVKIIETKYFNNEEEK